MSLGFFPRLIGVIRSPRTTFRAVAAAPRWVALVAGLTLVTAISQMALFATEVGQTALVDQWEWTALAFGQTVDDARYAGFQALSHYGPLYGLAMALVSGPLWTLVAAGVIFGVFRPNAQQSVSFSQVAAVVAHASVVLAIRQIVAAPLSYARETTGSASSLGAWLGTTSPVVGTFAGLDVFVLWWVVLVSIGVAVVYGRQARTTAATFVGIYAGVALLVGAAMTALGGTA